MNAWGPDRWGDFITITMLFLALALATYYAIRRTWKWERLGLALTLLMGLVTILFGFGSYTTALGNSSVLMHLRWVIRTAGVGVALYAIYIMKTDEPPKGEKP